jgi:hypothetical protein
VWTVSEHLFRLDDSRSNVVACVGVAFLIAGAALAVIAVEAGRE